LSEKNADTVTLEKLTRLYLQKQFLLSKTNQGRIENVADALCGLHAQAALTPYLSLWNRVKDFKSEMLDDALHREKSLVKTWCMRGTLHIIPSRDLPIYHNALERMWFEHHGRYMREPDWPSREMRQKLFYPRILEALTEKPLRRKELDYRVLSKFADVPKPYERLFSGWGGILKETAYLGLTVHAEPCGNESCFTRLDKWLPQIDLDEIDEDEAKEQLLLKYLRGYGPASAQDFTCWSGLMAGEARKAIENTQSELVEVKIEGSGRILLMLKKDIKELEKIDLEEEVQLRLLPKFDSFMLGHKDRSRMIKGEFMKHVYRKAGDIAASVLVNGYVAGTWKYKKTKRKLTVAVTPFEKLSRETIAELEHRVKELGTFMKIEQANVVLTK
jgi:hypothetical protein